MEKELNTNNSKKLIIGVSILFCAIIIVIGVTTAYFTQSGIGETGNIVSTNQVILHYDDSNNNYMFGELIPINENDVETAYNKTENKCKDDEGYNVCSIYQFTITNTGNVSQDILIDLYPIANSFHNLKFNLYDITNDKEILLSKKELNFQDYEEINLVNFLTLNTTNNNSNTYELVFYIKNDPYNDQTSLDAGKEFGANIRVNSLTTGKYLIEEINEEYKCWETELIEGTNNDYRLTKFYGIDNTKTIQDAEGNDIDNPNYGSVKQICENIYVTTTGDSYSINIPSTYGGKRITTIGNSLFTAMDLETGEPNNYNLINNIVIDDKIEVIEGITEEVESSPFLFIGCDLENEGFLFDLNVKLPNKLKEIGVGSFANTSVKNLVLPPNLKTIGASAFYLTNLTMGEDNPLIIPESITYIGELAFNTNPGITKLVFDGLLTEVNGNNKLTIGEGAFAECELNYLDASSPLELPARIESVGYEAFRGSLDFNRNLKFIRYHGSEAILNTFGYNNSGTGWTQATYVKTAEEYDVNEAQTIGNNE